MKRFVVWLCGALLIIAGVFTSCDKSEELVQTSQSELTETETSQLRSTSMFYGMEIVGVKPYADALHGRPNETQYKFYVANPSTDLLGVIVQFSPPAGGTVNKFMSKNSAGNFFLQQTLMQSGRYKVKYLLRYRTPKAEQTVTPNSGFIDNTLVNFDGEVKKLVWPFGDDGSSWNNRSGLNGWLWKGGEEQRKLNVPLGIRGYGHNEGTHKGTDEAYSDDWNRGRGDQDKDAIIHSPLDGVVEFSDDYPVSGYGDSQYVSIIQYASNGKTYRFYVSHLAERLVNKGDTVYAGVTPIGILGKSGASAYHAHCNLRDVTGGKKVSVPFDFSAQ